MSEINLSNLMNNLSVNEISVRDQEPYNNLSRIINNTNIVSNFFNSYHNEEVIKKFINTNIFVFRMYLGLDIFTKKYENVSKAFVFELHTIKEGLNFFLKNFNENNIDYNLSFIKGFNSNLYRFIIYHQYDTGYLI